MGYAIINLLNDFFLLFFIESNSNSFEDFFEHVHIKLLTCYIRSEPLPEHEIQAREVQCLYGIQIMSAALEHPGGKFPNRVRLLDLRYYNVLLIK